MKKSRIFLLCIIVFCFLVFGVSLITAFYIDPPVPEKTPGETVWFYRRLVRTPFLFSADSIALQNGAVPTDEIREAISRNVRTRIARFVLIRFPFNRTLYLITTDNKDFLRAEDEASTGN